MVKKNITAIERWGILQKGLDALLFDEKEMFLLLHDLDEDIQGPRIQECLKAEGIFVCRQLVTCSESDLLNIENFDDEMLEKVKNKLSEYNLHLGMTSIELQTIAREHPNYSKIRIYALPRKVEHCSFSATTEKCLKAIGINTVRQLITYSEEDLMNIKNFDAKNLKEVKEMLSIYDFQLGMTEEEIYHIDPKGFKEELREKRKIIKKMENEIAAKKALLTEREKCLKESIKLDARIEELKIELSKLNNPEKGATK